MQLYGTDAGSRIAQAAPPLGARTSANLRAPRPSPHTRTRTLPASRASTGRVSGRSGSRVRAGTDAPRADSSSGTTPVGKPKPIGQTPGGHGAFTLKRIEQSPPHLHLRGRRPGHAGDHHQGDGIRLAERKDVGPATLVAPSAVVWVVWMENPIPASETRRCVSSTTMWLAEDRATSLRRLGRRSDGSAHRPARHDPGVARSPPA